MEREDGDASASTAAVASEGWEDDDLESPSPTTATTRTTSEPTKNVATLATTPSQQTRPPSKLHTAAPASINKAAATSLTLDDANEELSQLIISGSVQTEDVKALKFILNEHVSLKEKVEKLKSLLGRSAKAQREAKMDSDASRKRLLQAMREIEGLKVKLEKLQTRPSHLELLMDFETNFDKALLSVGNSQQSGGQETEDGGAGKHTDDDASPHPPKESSSPLDSMLLHELTEAKTRIEKLETLNGALMSRSSQLEHSHAALKKERDDANDATSRLQMQLRMAQLEADQAQRAMMDKVASLEEMQLEIDCLAKVSFQNSKKAQKGEEAATAQKNDKQKIAQLEGQVQALKEWAMASSEAKQLMQERCRILETKLKQQQQQQNILPTKDDPTDGERVLFQSKGSMVIGAGDTGHTVVKLGDHAMTVDARFCILRWKFDLTQEDSTIDFNVMKGRCETSKEQAKAVYLIKDRAITGGAGGETEGAFNHPDAACTMVWSNVKSWFRPKTVKYTLEVVAIK
jgi:hypothetical protein